MIERYEIKKINNREELYLYFNFNYEFSIKDFNNRRRKIQETIKEYIKKNKIAFKGNIVTLIVGGVVVGNVLLKNSYSINEKKDTISYVTNSITEKIHDIDVLQKIIQEDKKKEKEEAIQQQEFDNVKKDTSLIKEVKKQVALKPVKQESNKKEIQEKIIPEETIDNNIYINLIRNGQEIKMELEEYIIGVVGGEMPASFHIEALKSQAVIARTYALKKKNQGKSLKDNEANQTYKSQEELKSLWGSSFDSYYKKVKDAVNTTKGMYLSYNGHYIEAVYHSTSNGMTEDSINVWGNSYPYLISVESKYDQSNKSYLSEKVMSYEEVSQKLGVEVNEQIEIKILSKTSGNRVKQIDINGKVFKGTDIRNILGLRSADFDIILNEDNMLFTTRGYGHGVGLSQYGANGYAKEGLSFKQILAHYYPHTTLKIQQLY